MSLRFSKRRSWVCVLSAVVAVTSFVNKSRSQNDLESNEGVSDLKSIYSYVLKYKEGNAGAFPKSGQDLFIYTLKGEKGLKGSDSILQVLKNKDVQFSDDKTLRSNPSKVIPYMIFGTRLDGSPIGSPKPAGSKDVLASTDLYVHNRYSTTKSGTVFNPQGYHLVLWDDGSISSIPVDLTLYVVNGERAYTAYPDQAGVNTLHAESYQELFAGAESTTLFGKPSAKGENKVVLDNGAPESLVALSRLMNFPDRNGIDREKLWQALSPSQETFTLKQTLEGAAQLGLPLQQKKLTLAQLTALHSPAILQLSGDIVALNPLRRNSASSSSPTPTSTNRIVTLAQAGIEYSIVQDQGMTRIVRNEQLAALLSGEVLIPQAVTTALPLRADNPVRVVLMKTTNDSSVQTITLTNDGKTPLNLEIERPIPGVTRALLSSKTLAPGASATLTLTIKWREILPGDTQNVYATLRTDNPQQPRLMMGFQLNLPAAPPVSATPSGTPPELP